MSMEFPEPFDPGNEEGNSWELIPAGEYVAQVIEAQIAPPGTGDGYALTLVWKILKGDFEGRQVWQQLCYLHSKEQTQTIARKALKDICDALDIHEAVQSAEIFLFKPACVRIGIRKDKNGVYQDQNKVGRVLPLAADGTSGKPDPVTGPKSGPDKSDNGGATASSDEPSDASVKPSGTTKPSSPPRTQGPPRPGPAGSSPWHKQQQR
jgi:hypothetical protein